MESSDELTPHYNDNSLMSRLRELLLEKERAKVENLESEITSLEEEIENLHAQILSREDIVPMVKENMGDITKDAVETQRNKMAKALSPIIGEATRYQIQESSEEMVEALYPIVGAAVSRAVGEALNDLRKRIDQQIRPNRNSVEVNLMNRLRGVDPAEVAFRNALPFQVNQLFLIQHESGLVLEFVNQNSEELNDHDLVSSMLTAIRSFVNDSFSPDSNDDELREVYFGDDRIIIESGTVAYAAAVISGIEPEGFRSLLRMFVNELHIQHKDEFENYEGDPESLPDLKTPTETFIEEAQEKDREQKNQSVLDMSSEDASRLARTTGIVAVVLLIGFCLFYGIMTYRLLPYAFGTVTEKAAPVVFDEAPQQQIVVITATPDRTPATATPIPPTPRPAISKIELSISKWSRIYPDTDAPQHVAIDAGTVLNVRKILDGWVEAEWEDSNLGQVNGWVRIDWLSDIE